MNKTWRAAGFLVLACVAGCSAGTGRSPDTGAATSPPPAPATGRAASTPHPEGANPQPYGSVDANPSDPPLVLDNHGSVPRRPPARTLPPGWNSAAWFASVRAAAGPRLTERQYPVSVPARGDTVLAWEWAATGVRKAGVSAELDPHHDPIVLNCYGQGINPSDQQAVSSLSSIITRCLTAPFPGADPAAATPWVKQQLTLMLRDIRANPRATQVASSTPTFGSAVYWLQEVDNPQYGVTFTLQVT